MKKINKELDELSPEGFSSLLSEDFATEIKTDVGSKTIKPLEDYGEELSNDEISELFAKAEEYGFLKGNRRLILESIIEANEKYKDGFDLNF